MSSGVYVFAEQRDGKLLKIAFELVGKCRELADDLGQEVVAVLLGSNIKDKTQSLIEHGADKVIYVDDPMLENYSTEPYTKILFDIVKKCDPEIFLYGATAIGRDLAPRVSARVHTGLTADCTSLSIDQNTKHLLMTRPAFGGNIMATIVCEKFRPQMATVRPGVMKALPVDQSRKGEINPFDIKLEASDMNITIKEVVKSTKKTRDIQDAKILVSGGRGIGGPEGFEPLRELAVLLDAEVSSSRSCVDEGWIEKDRQVGQTGKTVRPDLYLACGISGAIQHVAGMENAEFIIAINKNDTAAIFDVADVGVVGDLKVIIPMLTDAIKKIKSEQ